MDVLQNKLQQLTDVDLAILVSLASGQHCIFSSEPHLVQDLRTELCLTCTETYGLQTAVVDCTARTTVEEFSEAILVDVIDDFEDTTKQRGSTAPARPALDSFRRVSHSASRLGSLSNNLDERRIADVVIATSLDIAGSQVQVQTLELLRTKRIFTRTSMHTASKDFLFVLVLSKQGARLSHHLNDMFAMSHHHNEEDGMPRQERHGETAILPSFSRDEVSSVRDLTEKVNFAGEVRAYLHNIVVFLRNSRYVKGGATAAATRHLRSVAAALAPLHGLDYIPPSLVELAVRKVYSHRLILATAETERSLQWGSDPEALREMLKGITVDDVIEDVLGDVETPL